MNLKTLSPVLMAFFVMSFVDLVGIGVDRAKQDFELSNTLAQIIPFVVFLWFFLLSVPVGIFQDKHGKKKTLNIGISITALGLIIPIIFYSFPVFLLGFVLSMVLIVFLVVGLDVGINATSGQFLMNKLCMDQSIAESGRSMYFFGTMLGTFAGALLLVYIASRKFLVWTSLRGLVVIIAFIFYPTSAGAWILIFLFGLMLANIFPLAFSIAVGKLPERANEISGLMMMAISDI